MTAELALVVMALVTSLATFGLVLTLLVRDRNRYASHKDVADLRDHLTGELGRYQAGLSQLYRYAEAIDVHTGANGYRVLRRPVSKPDRSSRD